MIEIAPKYDPKTTENKWYDFWMKKKYFRSVPDQRTPYTIVIPPPNVTGILHMGHMLNNTLQDVIIRRARMKGFNALWVPGTDHASISTEAKVVAKLREENIDKSSLTREEFLEHAWDWKHKYGGIILEQLKKLGASCDWDRTCFTMDDHLYRSVIHVFVDLYNKGLIYRGVRMVNWDPKALTAISDEEVIPTELKSKLYYIRYFLEGSAEEFITIATTRPETILGDTAVCVHPEDDRYRHLAGKKVLVPLINRSIPVIFDEYVDREFGTGCLKITPAHDVNDYNIGIKHHLETIDIFNDNGTLNEKAIIYVGRDRFDVRDAISEELTEKGYMVKIEDYINRVGFSERTHVAIEPKLSLQWFMKMDGMAKGALEVVLNDQVRFLPPKFKNTYRHWMENVKDWCISRQLWWGQRIPAYYLPDGEVVVAETAEEALQLARKLLNNPSLTMDSLQQDEDVLDTWFSSWLWPISVFNGILEPDNEDIRYYYPTNDLITAPEIMFFWVARMIMSGLEYRKDIPFSNVYYTGIVRDHQGRKMSKSLGNSPDPLDLIDKYGADGVRVGMLFSSPAGNDLLYDEALCEQGRNFNNKIWNALRLVLGWQTDASLPQPQSSKIAAEWFREKLNQSLQSFEDNFDKFRISDALMDIYKLIWDDFCSWYLEMIKPGYQKPVDPLTRSITIGFFEKLMKILHPFMPFITEEIWHHLAERNEEDNIIISKFPATEDFDSTLINRFEFSKEIINAIRSIRADKGISPREELQVYYAGNNPDDLESLRLFKPVISKLSNLSDLSPSAGKVEGAITFVIKSAEFSIPLGSRINVEEEITKLETELQYSKGFLESVVRKLSNENFVSRAPENVINAERKKQADTEARIRILEDQITSLKGQKSD